jgi:O-acetyl-ADP-ribose deacetylase (regulator of RNase III)
MSCQKEVNNRVIKVMVGDITELDLDCFVFYAQPDLKLGAGFGGAISVRGGPTIQEELDKLAPVGPNESVITGAGDLKANFIIHTNGPRFQEENLEDKLATTMLNALRLADEKGIRGIAFPAMGAGFYVVPLETSARVSIGAAREYLQGNTGLEEIVFCVIDNREYKPFEKVLQNLG